MVGEGGRGRGADTGAERVKGGASPPKGASARCWGVMPILRRADSRATVPFSLTAWGAPCHSFSPTLSRCVTAPHTHSSLESLSHAVSLSLTLTPPWSHSQGEGGLLLAWHQMASLRGCDKSREPFLK